MSESQHQQPKPHHTWFSTKSFSENCSNLRVKKMAVQVPSGLSPMYDDIQVAAVAAKAKAHYVLSSPPPLSSSIPRKKGMAWTEAEHKLFLIGLKKFGKGDWKSISRFSVVSRSPCQVASHAQKYFLRQNVPKKKRKSIHDITLEESDHVLLSRPINHHNLVTVPENQYLDINHQNSVPLPQNHCLDITTPEGSGQFLVPHHSNHQNLVVPMSRTTNHQNSILPLQNRDLPSQNWMYRMVPEMLQALPSLPPNNYDEYQYCYSAMFNSFGCFNNIR